MRRGRHRPRLVRSPLALLSLLAALLPAVAVPSALAQDPGAGLRLLSQTTWTTPHRSVWRADVRIESERDLPDASLVVTVMEPLLGRSELRLAMEQDTGEPLLSATYDLEEIEGGTPLDREIKLRVASLEGVADEGRVYPVRIDLAEGTDPSVAPIATMRTALVFLPVEPEQPLNLAWTFVLGHPIDFGPDGVFVNRSMERRLMPEQGSLWGMATELAGMLTSREPVPADVVVSPTLLENLNAMRDGYEVVTGDGLIEVPEGVGGAADAQRVLEAMRVIAQAPETEVSAMPLAVPDLPQMVASGFAGDIPVQLQAGRVQVAEAFDTGTFAFRTPVEPALLRPPGSSIDEESLRILRKEGVRALLLDEGVVEQPAQPNDFAPPATAEIAPGLTGVVPDEGLQQLIADALAHEDPYLAAQWLLADLASIWLEQPDTERSAAFIVSGEQDLSPEFFRPLVHGVQSAPWLRATKATNLLQRFPPTDPPEQVRLRQGDPMPASYIAWIELNRELIGQLTEIISDPDDLGIPASLGRTLLFTQGGSLVDRQRLGEAWLRDIEGTVRTEFSKVGADTAQVVTLTASGGRIPVRVSNSGDLELQIRVVLRSSRLEFPTGSGRALTLGPGDTRVLVFDAIARTTGTFPVQVVVETPDEAVLSETQIIVRSTAYNLFALAITLGAILVLLVIWGRRHLSLKRR